MDATLSAGHGRFADDSVRTRVTLPPRLADGYEVTTAAITFDGLAGGKNARPAEGGRDCTAAETP